MAKITQEQLTEHGVHRFAAEASTLGLLPGQWPRSIDTTVGNAQPFLQISKKVDGGGETLWVTYRQQLGCIALRIYND